MNGTPPPRFVFALRLLDPASGRVLANAWVTVCDGRIESLAEGLAGPPTGPAANIAAALRSGTSGSDIPSQPWSTDRVPEGAGVDATRQRISQHASDFTNGLVSSLFQSVDGLRTAAGLQAFNNQQVGELNKAFSRGLAFGINYTFSRSLDDFAEVTNDSGNVPTAFFHNIAYGPSQFDRTHALNATVDYTLPFHPGSGLLSNLVGGRSIASIITADSGRPDFFSEGGQALGGGTRAMQDTGMIPTVGISTLGEGVHTGVAGSGGFGAPGDPTSGGSGPNLFADPQSVYNDFPPVLLSTDTSVGNSNPIRGLPFCEVHTSLAKALNVTERVHGTFEAEAFNLFNNVIFNDHDLSYTNKASFGVLDSQLVPANRIDGSRWIELGLRLDF
ncbi:MAG: hypothetical protein ACRD01_03695 [Terriglobales bacterium]